MEPKPLYFLSIRNWLTKFVLLCCLQVSSNIYGQIQVSGTVTDSLTGEVIPFVKIKFLSANTFEATNIEGSFSIESPYHYDTLKLQYIGYRPIEIPLTDTVISGLTIQLSELSMNLTAVVIEAGENPAFEILRQVKNNKKRNNPEALMAYECEVYNKMQFNLHNLSEGFESNPLFRKFDFIMNYIDSADGDKYLPVLLTESLSDYYYKSNPTQKKEVIRATRVTGVDNLELGQFTGDLYQNVNVYEDYIGLFNKEFMSPIANEGKLFYKYYLQPNDTLDGTPCYHIKFIPKRRGDALFEGEMWITHEQYALRLLKASIPNGVNLNYVSDFKVEQQYGMVDSNYMLVQEQMTADFDLFNEQENTRLIGVTIHKNVTRKNFLLNAVKPFNFYVKDIVIEDSADHRSEEYWQIERHSDLSKEENGVIKMVDSLKQNKTYRLFENFTYMGYTGFWRAGPVEFGSIYTGFNRNVVEGTRLMLSVRTSNQFSKKVEISGFTAYGTLDQDWKYGGSLRWKLQESPREMLRFAYRKRIDQLGLIATIGDVGNNFSTLLSAAPLDKLTMVKLGSVEFEKDWSFDMRTFNAVEWKNYVPLGSSDYSRINPESGDTNKINSLTSFQVRNQIMFTKEEKFLKGQFDRISLGSRYPIISITHTWGIKHVLESEYDFHRLDFIWTHRPRFGMLGRLNYTIHAGKIFGQVPYPFLQIHQGNETYYLQAYNFNLMNYYEFISDQWVRVLFEHQFQGFIMDRIPLIRKLKFRAVASGKMVIGTYSAKHNQEMLLPFYSQRLTSPYYEVGAGLENILKFIRIDAIWRLSYRDNVDLYGDPVANFGVKFMFTYDF